MSCEYHLQGLDRTVGRATVLYGTVYIGSRHWRLGHEAAGHSADVLAWRIHESHQWSRHAETCPRWIGQQVPDGPVYCDRGRLGSMLRPESWSRLTGESPVRVGTGAPGSRPRFVVERRRAERGVESLFGGSKRAGCSVKRTLRPRQSHSGGAEPLMSRRRPCLAGPGPGSACRVLPGYGGRHVRTVWAGTGEARLPGTCTLGRPIPGHKSGSTGTGSTGSAAPSAIRRQRNHARKTIGKPYAGKPHVRIERGMGKRAIMAPRP